jgi:hypothetical protein
MLTPSNRSRPRNHTAVVVGLLAVALVALFSIRILSALEWDATVFVGFGGEAIPIREYAEERLGPVFLRVDQGHDGKYFFVQANDPFVLEPESNAGLLERPLYRSQRMFYPLLAGAGGLLSPGAIVWALLVINVLAMGAGTWATAWIAQTMGVSPWWGLAFVLNPGFISELIIDGAGVVAAVAAFAAVGCILHRRLGLAILLLSVAALTREAMLIAAVGSGLWWWRQSEESRKAVMIVAIPTAAVGLWALYLRWRIGWDSGVSEVEEIGWPFVGFFRAAETWIGDPLDLVIGFALMAMLLVYAWRGFISRELVGWAFLGFVGLGVLFTEQVWENYFDITRAIAPVITAFALLIAVSRHSERSGARPRPLGTLT